MAKKKKKKKGFLYISLIAISAFILSFILINFYPIQVLELNFKDQLFEWRGLLDVSDSPTVLVAISQKADEEIPEKYPWPTSVHARLVENLNQAGAKVIAFDVLFEGRDSYDAKNDTLFAEAIKKHGNVILAGELNKTTGDNAELTEPQFPIDILQQSNPNRTALVRVIPDLDGAIRTYNFGHIYEADSKNYYRLGIEVIKEYLDIPYEEIDETRPNPGSEYFKLGHMMC
ncbi:CHASE2 domain-containing protein [Gracilimonas sp.]|uniref:CHASE2 domain-containing protein n=1 Tax=Gracilimonas sp. TaxID=1974203 RepID=UPI002871CAFD|nr:CHASE2 domain-containing protein [Gracilimonas sp.]